MFDPTAFSTDFALPIIQPGPIENPPEQQDDDTGPWIREGVIHIGRKPNH